MIDRYIRFAALHMPHAPAIATVGGQVGYRALHEAVERVAAALAEDGVEAGSAETLVGLAVRDPYAHALLILACARLGVASTSLFADMVEGTARLTGATLILADAAVAGARVLDGDWFARAAARPPLPMPTMRVDPAALARVQLSSGSTGTPKAVGLSWAMLDTRAANSVLSGAGLRRVLSLVGPESGALQLMISCWRSRGCVLLGPDTPAALTAALPALAPGALLASPVQLAALAAAIPADMALAGDLTVLVTGGKAPRALRDKVALALGAAVVAVYASTEAGTSALGYSARLLSDDAVGFVTPATELEIVGEDGEVVAAGEVGRIRLRGPEVVAGYRGPDAAGGDTFRDGWFYPGDLGRIDGEGALQVVGRVDEIMNFGGEKVVPDLLEELVRGVAGVADVAAFALDDADGNAQPWLAVVRSGEVAEGAIGRALTVPNLPAVRIAWIDAIPRTVMGKVRREALQEAARQLGRG